jgi:hypothetical protein
LNLDAEEIQYLDIRRLLSKFDFEGKNTTYAKVLIMNRFMAFFNYLQLSKCLCSESHCDKH